MTNKDLERTKKYLFSLNECPYCKCKHINIYPDWDTELCTGSSKLYSDAAAHRVKRWYAVCPQCGDCSRACEKENPGESAMSTIYLEQAKTSDSLAGLPESSTATELRKVRAMNEEERLDYWNRQMEKCIKCHKCEKVCPMYLNIVEITHNPDCIKCGRCIDVCPKDALSFKK